MENYQQIKFEKDILNKEVLLTILENTGTAMFIINEDRKIIYANKHSIFNTGYTKNEIVGKDWLDFIHRDDAALLTSYHSSRTEQQEVPSSYETKIIIKTGEIVPVHMHVKFVECAKICIVSIIDISEHRKLLVDMNEKSEFINRLYTNASDGLITFDEQGQVSNINDAMLKTLYMERDEVLGKHYNEITSLLGFDIMKISKSHNDFIENFDSVYRGEWKITNFKGEKRILEISSTILKKENKINGLILCAHDITQRKQTEDINKMLYNISKAANETSYIKDFIRIIKKELKEIIDIKNFYIALYDQQRKLFYVPFYESNNPEVFGKGKTLASYVYKTGKTLHATIDKQNELFEKDEIDISVPQPKIWIGVPLKTENNVIGVLAILDYYNPQKYSKQDIEILEFVSGEIAKAIERQQAKLQLEKELKEKIVILAEIHHRVNNNLQVISGLLQLQANQIKTKEDALRGFRESQSRIMVMAEVYKALHDSDYLSDINIRNFIRSISQSLLNEYGNRDKILLKYSINKISLNMEILVPLGLIFHELLSNAMKYAFGDKEKGTIHIAIKKSENDYLIIVEDNGKGIPEHINFQKPKTLGLSLVKMLKEQIGAKLKVERKRGTKFVLSIPFTG